MYEHEPEATRFRVTVALRPGGTQFATMPAHEGMALGEIGDGRVRTSPRPT